MQEPEFKTGNLSQNNSGRSQKLWLQNSGSLKRYVAQAFPTSANGTHP